MRGLPDYKLPDLELCISRNVEAARLTNPAVTCIGIAVNTAAMSEEEALAYLQQTERDTGLPTQDPVRQGVDRLVDNLPA